MMKGITAIYPNTYIPHGIYGDDAESCFKRAVLAYRCAKEEAESAKKYLAQGWKDYYFDAMSSRKYYIEKYYDETRKAEAQGYMIGYSQGTYTLYKEVAE